MWTRMRKGGIEYVETYEYAKTYRVCEREREREREGNIRATNRIQQFPETRALFFADGTQEVILQHKYTQMGNSLLTECTDGTHKKIKKIPGPPMTPTSSFT
jgi:hypothetical protein